MAADTGPLAMRDIAGPVVKPGVAGLFPGLCFGVIRPQPPGLVDAGRARLDILQREQYAEESRWICYLSSCALNVWQRSQLRIR